MKLKNKIIGAAAALSFLTVAAGGLQAQVNQLLTVTATAYVQGDSSDNGTVTTAAAPTKVSVGTKQLLEALAVDEHAADLYPSTTFPSGAKLVTVDGNNDSPDFQVLDKSDNLLVDVTNIVSFGQPGNNTVFSGKQNDNNGLASPATANLQLLTFAFDDTAISGSENIKFYFTGIGSSTTTDTTPNGGGVYSETDKGSLTSGTGEGTYQGNQLLITGSAKASGKGTLTLAP